MTLSTGSCGVHRMYHQVQDYTTFAGNADASTDDGSGAAAAEAAGNADVAADPLAAMLNAHELRGKPWPVG